jgi:PKD repeat protein
MGMAPLTVQFNDTSSGSPTAWQWYFGDNTYSGEKNPSHTYMAAGSYTVSHAAINGMGTSWMNRTAYVNVTSSAPVANFTATPVSGTRPLTVQFTDTSTGSPTEWAWDFTNDGTVDSTEQNPSYQYETAGTYSVRLNVTNAGRSNMVVKMGLVTVTVPVALTYSITDCETYRANMSNLFWMGTLVCDNVSSILNSTGWSQQFYHKDFYVTEEDLGSTGNGLTNSVLHYHFGHGNESKGIALVKPDLLGNYPLKPIDYLNSSQVYKKWGNQNKWIIIDSCQVLSDPSWGDALVTSHGILGFASTKTPNSQLPVRFFHYAMDEDRTVENAWRTATLETYAGTDTIAAYRIDTAYQVVHDHLPGHGEVAPDENPDDGSSEYDQWNC